MSLGYLSLRCTTGDQDHLNEFITVATNYLGRYIVRDLKTFNNDEYLSYQCIVPGLSIYIDFSKEQYLNSIDDDDNSIFDLALQDAGMVILSDGWDVALTPA